MVVCNYNILFIIISTFFLPSYIVLDLVVKIIEFQNLLHKDDDS